MRGEVIGINTAIASRSGGYQGIGFALPINTGANRLQPDHQDWQGNARLDRHSVHAIRHRAGPEPVEGEWRYRRRLRAIGGAGRTFGQGGHEGWRHHPLDQRQDAPHRRRSRGHRDGDSHWPSRSTWWCCTMANSVRDLKVIVGDLAQLFPDAFRRRNEAGSCERRSRAAGLWHGDPAANGEPTQVARHQGTGRRVDFRRRAEFFRL